MAESSAGGNALGGMGGNALEVLTSLKRLYTERLRPVEREAHFVHFSAAFPHVRSSELSESELESKPQVLLIGQYSTGKTTLIKWLTGIESTFFDIRPQPSTDKFVAVVHGKEERVINGDAACCLADLPYGGLAQFGHAFLSKFQVLVEDADILQHVSFVDTPGVLSGDKQRISRGYDFAAISQWLAARSDLVLLLFDAHKLDISDEFRGVIESIRGAADKCRCVLNKADEIDGENLVKVNGALMWNLGRILNSPEVARMYVGSFWDGEYKTKDLEKLLDRDRKELVQELKDLPRSVCVRRINEVVLRTRTVKVQLALGACLRSKLPPYWGSCCGRRRRRQVWLCDNLPGIFDQLVDEKRVVKGDLPSLTGFREKLLLFGDFRQFPHWDPKRIEELDQILASDVPAMMANVGGVSPSEGREHAHKTAQSAAADKAASPAAAGSRRFCARRCFAYVCAVVVVAFVLFMGFSSSSWQGRVGDWYSRDVAASLERAWPSWASNTPAAPLQKPPAEPRTGLQAAWPLSWLAPTPAKPPEPPPPPPKGLGARLSESLRIFGAWHGRKSQEL